MFIPNGVKKRPQIQHVRILAEMIDIEQIKFSIKWCLNVATRLLAEIVANS